MMGSATASGMMSVRRGRAGVVRGRMAVEGERRTRRGRAGVRTCREAEGQGIRALAVGDSD